MVVFICLLGWSWWVYHGCVPKSKLIKLYSLSMCQRGVLVYELSISNNFFLKICLSYCLWLQFTHFAAINIPFGKNKQTKNKQTKKTHCLFLHLLMSIWIVSSFSIGRYLDCFQIFAIMSNASMNIIVCVFWRRHARNSSGLSECFLQCHPRVFLVSIVYLCLNL